MILKVSRSFAGIKYPYRLVLRSETNNKGKTIQVVYVERDFNKTGEWEIIPSGWCIDYVKYSVRLVIDLGLNWFVYPTIEAWDDILQ